MDGLKKRLQSLLSSVVESMGYEFVGFDMNRDSVRVYIDRPEGAVTVGDCTQVSEQLSTVLDVEDPITTHYTLEVSSPGVDRPLFSLEQFKRFIGEKVEMHLYAPVDGRRNMIGLLQGVNEKDEVQVQMEEGSITVPYKMISKANLVDYKKSK